MYILINYVNYLLSVFYLNVYFRKLIVVEMMWNILKQDTSCQKGVNPSIALFEKA